MADWARCCRGKRACQSVKSARQSRLCSICPIYRDQKVGILPAHLVGAGVANRHRRIDGFVYFFSKGDASVQNSNALIASKSVKLVASIVLAASWVCGSGRVDAQVVCSKCGQIHAAAQPLAQSAAQSFAQPSGSTSSTVVSNRPPITINQGVAASAAPVVSPASSGGVSNVLSMLNRQRARQGIGTLRFDPALQAVAQRRARQMASSGTKSHPPGSFSPGRYEGVGWSSSYSPNTVMACYTSDPSMQVAGAAMATGRDGVYFAVVYR